MIIFWHKIKWPHIFSTKHDQHYVRICPHCGSTDTKIDFSNPVVWAYGTSVEYECNNCGEQGKIFPEVLKGDEKFSSNKIKNANKRRPVHSDKLFNLRQALSISTVLLGVAIGMFLGLTPAFLFYAIAIILKLIFTKSH